MGAIQQALLSIAPPAGGGGISLLTGMWDWWEPELEGLSNGANITQLTGQKSPGTGHNWTTSTCAGVPTFAANVINGLGAARFNGEHCLGNVDPSALTAMHMFRVVKIDAENSADTLGDFCTDVVNIPELYTWVDGKIYDGSGSNLRRDCGNPAATLTSWRVFETISTSSEWTALLDGTQLFTTGTNTVSIPSNCKLGANTTRNLVGHIAGVYIFASKITGSDRTDMVNYLNDRWGLSVS